MFDRSTRLIASVGVCSVMALLPAAELDAAPFASFQGLGDLRGGGTWSFAYATSADGAVVVGASDSSHREAFRWTAGGGMVRMRDLPGGLFQSQANATSADGAVVVGFGTSAAGAEAFRWMAGGGMVGLGDLPGGLFASVAYGTSADGSVVVGGGNSASGPEAFRWTSGGGMVGLGDLPGGLFASVAYGTSADGSVVAGHGFTTSGLEAFRWTAGGGMVGLGIMPGGDTWSVAYATSADGAVVVGGALSAFGFEAFRWTEGGGMVGLGDLPGGFFHSRANATSADGAVVVGFSDSASGNKAFLWTAEDGMRSLRDLLVTDFGLDLTGWGLFEATGISADGRTIVGVGRNPDGFIEAWVATLPEPTTLSLDIKPGSCPNAFNRNSHGVLPVALLGTDEFDVADVDLNSLMLMRADGVGGFVAPYEGPPGPHSTYEDVGTPFEGEVCDCHEVGGDGLLDLSMKFKTDMVVENLELGDLASGALVELMLVGELIDGTPFEASDCVWLVPPGAGPAQLDVSTRVNQEWVADTWVDLSPVDIMLEGGGFNSFRRTYFETTLVTLTAPSVSMHDFDYWLVDGVAQAHGQAIVQVVIEPGTHTVEAVYLPLLHMQPIRRAPAGPR